MTHIAESLHWYAQDGSPAYEVEAVKGGMRPATLRDARKLGLVPSVTTIIKCAAAPGLERWKANQVLLAALTLPRQIGETDDAYARRVMDDSREQARKAAEKGTAIHAAIQGHYEGAAPDESLWPYVKAAAAELDERVETAWVAEKAFAHPLGFGGKVDLHTSDGPGVVADVKSKDFGPDSDKLAWDEHCIQLAAYRVGLGMPKAECFNLFVSTRQPGLVRVHVWSEDDLQRGWRMFQSLLDYWKAKNSLETAFKEAA